MPYMIRKDGEKWCVYKRGEDDEPEGDTLGCHDSEEEAMAQMHAIGMRTHEGAGREVWITHEQMIAICPSCAEKMKSLGYTRLNLAQLKQMPQQLLDGLCAALGGDPGLFTSCMNRDFGEFDPGDKEAFCAWLHEQCTGTSPGAHRGERAGRGPREFKSSPFFVKQIDDRIVKQIFAVMGVVDDGHDRLWPGALTKTLNEHRHRIKVLWQHDTTQPPIGVPVKIMELGRADLPADLVQKYPEATGAAYAEIKYLDTPRGNEVLAGIREGAITENSFGYDALVAPRDEKDADIRNLKEIRLWDISPVNWGMNAATMNLKLAAIWELADLERAVRAARALSARTLTQAKLLSPGDLDRWHKALADLTDLLSAEPPAAARQALSAQMVLARLAIAERELAIY